MNLRHVAASIVTASLVACSGGLAEPSGDSTKNPSPTPPAPNPTAPAPSSPPNTGSPVPAGVVGVFHHSRLAATNLALRADGSFTWATEKECGEARGQCGTWTVSKNGGVELLAAFEEPLRWIETGEPMQRISVEETREGIALTGVSIDGVTLHESWDVGRMCPVCRGGPGPAAQATCETPLPDVCSR